jgi:hypothetical protein
VVESIQKLADGAGLDAAFLPGLNAVQSKAIIAMNQSDNLAGTEAVGNDRAIQPFDFNFQTAATGPVLTVNITAAKPFHNFVFADGLFL